jgi:hypothetical protein
MAQTYSQQLRAANGMLVVLAVWQMMSPFGLGVYLSNAPLLNSVIVALLITCFAIFPNRFTPPLQWV